ncbi:MAG TPA: hypothetical protein VGM26_15820 [Rhizomicrobium sp.]|jgi:hypothetical protein
MRPVAIFVLAAVLSLSTGAVSAKTVNGGQGNANDRSVAAVAGPPKAENNSAKADENSAKQPSKAELKKSKIKTPPPPHDPN